MKNKIKCLQVDYENGDGSELYKLTPRGQGVVDFLYMLEQRDEPAKCQIVFLSKQEWDKARKLAKEIGF